jgi:hypothetical protein
MALMSPLRKRKFWAWAAGMAPSTASSAIAAPAIQTLSRERLGMRLIMGSFPDGF